MKEPDINRKLKKMTHASAGLLGILGAFALAGNANDKTTDSIHEYTLDDSTITDVSAPELRHESLTAVKGSLEKIKDIVDKNLDNTNLEKSVYNLITRLHFSIDDDINEITEYDRVHNFDNIENLTRLELKGMAKKMLAIKTGIEQIMPQIKDQESKEVATEILTQCNQIIAKVLINSVTNK